MKVEVTHFIRLLTSSCTETQIMELRDTFQVIKRSWKHFVNHTVLFLHLLREPLDVHDPLILVAFTIKLYCRFHTSLSFVNAMLIAVVEMFKSMPLSVRLLPVLLSTRAISASHTGALYQQKKTFELGLQNWGKH